MFKCNVSPPISMLYLGNLCRSHQLNFFTKYCLETPNLFRFRWDLSKGIHCFLQDSLGGNSKTVMIGRSNFFPRYILMSGALNHFVLQLFSCSMH